MLFSAETEVPDGFECISIPPLEYAVCYLQGDQQNGELYSTETHDMCLNELRASGMKRKEDDWCFERYNCPRFTAPDENGNVILDYAISIEK